MASAARSAARSTVVVAALVGVMFLLRPGFVLQSAGSLRAWSTLLGVLLLILGTRHLVSRAIGPRAASGAAFAVALCAVALLIAPSFQQRTLNEPLPAALQQPGPGEIPAPAPTPSAPALAPRPLPSGAKPLAPASALATAPKPTSLPAAARRPSRSGAAPEQQLVGELRGIDHAASGVILLHTGSDGRFVRFDSVDIEGSVGPSVHLVARGQRRPNPGTRLGALKAERGSFSYALPPSVDVRKGWTLLIWCDPYDVPIAAADLA